MLVDPWGVEPQPAPCRGAVLPLSLWTLGRWCGWCRWQCLGLRTLGSLAHSRWCVAEIVGKLAAALRSDHASLGSYGSTLVEAGTAAVWLATASIHAPLVASLMATAVFSAGATHELQFQQLSFSEQEIDQTHQLFKQILVLPTGVEPVSTD